MHSHTILRSTINIHVIPRFVNDSATVVSRVLTGRRLVVSWSGTTDIRNGSRCLGQGTLHIGESDLSCVARSDSGLLEPCISRESLVILDCSLIEVNHIFVLCVIGSVARKLDSC